MSQTTEKMRPDEGVLNATSFESKALKKVQLDVDGAPFLEEEEPPLPATAPTSEVANPEEDEARKKKRKKLIILLSAGLLGLLLLIGLGVGAYMMFFSGPPPEEPLIVVLENYVEPTLPTTYDENLAPFWIEMKDPQGRTFFLVCTFVLSTEDVDIATEIAQKIPAIRDSIYYYLNTKSYEFLTNFASINEIKDELLKKINESLSKGKLTNLYYENYMVR